MIGTTPKHQGPVEIMTRGPDRPIGVGARVVITRGELTGSTGRVREIIPCQALVGPGARDRDTQDLPTQEFTVAWIEWEAKIIDLDHGNAVITPHAVRLSE